LHHHYRVDDSAVSLCGHVPEGFEVVKVDHDVVAIGPDLVYRNEQHLVDTTATPKRQDPTQVEVSNILATYQ
jgi:hypothetical protein